MSPVLGFIGAKDDGNGDDNWRYKTYIAPVKSSSTTTFYSRIYSVTSPKVSEKNGREMYHSTDLLTWRSSYLEDH